LGKIRIAKLKRFRKMNIKIVLVNLPWKKGNKWGVRAGSRWPHLKDHTEKNYLPFPFYLAYAAALLKKNGYDVHIIDAIAQELSYKAFRDKITALDAQLLVAETSTVTLKHDLEVLKSYNSSCKIALCGPEVNLSKEEFLKNNSHLDYLVYGEYETTLLELVQKSSNNASLAGVNGLIFRSNNRVIKNSPRPLIDDLDALPWPLRTELPLKKYNDTPGDIRRPCAVMWASRGCPFKCSFCLWPQVMYSGSSYRTRSVVDVVDEMEYLVRELKYNSIYFDDDTWNIGRKRIFEFCDELDSRKLKIPWAIMARAELMDEELLERMKKSGLFAVKYGVESASQELLDNIEKGTDLKKVEGIVKHTKYLGIKTHLTFTFGLPGENKQTIAKTIDLAIRLNPDTVQFSLATPFPGTRFFDQMQAKGYILSTDWEEFDGNHSCVIRTDDLSAKELEDAKRTAYQEWEKHKAKEQRFKMLKGARIIDKFRYNLKNRGILITFFLGVRFCFRRMLGLLSRFLDRFKPKKWIPDESIELNDLKLEFAKGKTKLFYKDKEVSKDVGINTSMVCGQKWLDSSQASWELEKISASKICLRLAWEHVPIRQKWIMSLEPDNSISWTSDIMLDEELEILEYKAGIMIQPAYNVWKDDQGTGAFPRIKGWEEIELYNPNSPWLKAIYHSAKNGKCLPHLQLTSAKVLPANVSVQIQNTNRSINARLLQMHALRVNRFTPGTYDYFDLKITLVDTQEQKNPLAPMFRNRTPFKFIKNQIKQNGIFMVLRKIMRNINVKILSAYYLEIMGILDGSIAYKGPFCVQIDLTNDCNNDCIGCWCNSPLLKERCIEDFVKQRTLPLAIVKKTINELSEMQTREIYFAGGGEPFMHPDILEILEYVKSKDMKCYINTNFTLIDEKIVKRLIAIGVDNLVVSVWAGTAKTYEVTHPNKSQEMFYQIKGMVRLMTKLRKQVPHINIYNVISSLNYTELEQMVDFALAINADSLEFTVIDTIPDATDSLILSDAQRNVVFESCQKIKKRLAAELKGKIKVLRLERFMRRVNNKDAAEAQYDRDILSQMPCYIGWLFTRILADGDVNFCLKAHRIPVGNIYAQNFSEIWNDSRQQAFRRKALSVPKKDVFFSYIGNDPNVEIGCFKGCDDLGRNLHMQDKLESLTTVELKVLKGILLLKKLCKNFRSQGLLAMLKHSTMKTSVQKSNVSKGHSDLIIHRDGIKVYWLGQEITESVGLSTSLKVFGLWYNSSKANWKIIEDNEDQLIISNSWNDLPISQDWRISYLDKNTISWESSLIVENQIELEESKTSMMLVPEYDQCQVGESRYFFPSAMQWDEIDLGSIDSKEIEVFPPSTKRGKLPVITFDFSCSSKEHKAQIQNSDKLINARIISARQVFESANKVYAPGKYQWSCVKIKVNSKDV